MCSNFILIEYTSFKMWALLYFLSQLIFIHLFDSFKNTWICFIICLKDFKHCLYEVVVTDHRTVRTWINIAILFLFLMLFFIFHLISTYTFSSNVAILCHLISWGWYAIIYVLIIIIIGAILYKFNWLCILFLIIEFKSPF